jgi:hypothetical protein
MGLCGLDLETVDYPEPYAGRMRAKHCIFCLPNFHPAVRMVTCASVPSTTHIYCLWKGAPLVLQNRPFTCLWGSEVWPSKKCLFYDIMLEERERSITSLSTKRSSVNWNGDLRFRRFKDLLRLLMETCACSLKSSRPATMEVCGRSLKTALSTIMC